MADKEIPQAEAAAQETAPAAETAAATPEKTEETTAATATGTTTTTEEATGAKAPATDAVGVEGYEAMKADALKRAAEAKEKKEEPPAEAAETFETPSATVAEETTAAAAEEIPAATAETTAAAEPAATTDEDDKDPPRIRIAGLEDSHLVASANRIARKEGIPFAEAWDRVAPKKPQAAATTTPAAEEAPKLRTREEINADITAQKAVKRKAATEMDNVAIIDADEAIEAFREELGKVDAAEQRAAQEREAASRTQFEATVTSSQAKANEYWPESIDKNSALSKRTVELADEYEKDPALAALVTKADSPFYFTQLAAQELGIVPKHLRKAAAATTATTPTKPATPTATKPAPTNQRAVIRPTQPAASPASGAARTTQGESSDTLGVDKVQSAHDYDMLKKRLKIPSLAQAR